jgi:hypothetical protein
MLFRNSWSGSAQSDVAGVAAHSCAFPCQRRRLGVAPRASHGSSCVRLRLLLDRPRILFVTICHIMNSEHRIERDLIKSAKLV